MSKNIKLERLADYYDGTDTSTELAEATYSPPETPAGEPMTTFAVRLPTTVLERVRQIAGDRRYRIWRVYLAGCAYAFEHGWTAIHQVLAVKAARPRAGPIPLTRDYMYGTSI